MAQKTRAQILAEIGTLLADNTSGDISPLDVRTVTEDLNDSLMINNTITRSALQTLISGSLVETNSIYQISNAVGATKVILVFGKTSSTISTLAINLTDNTFGNYDISGDTFTEAVPTLADVLDVGNTSGANNIVFDATYGIELDNTSTLKEGSYDFGGAGGISRICGVGYEDMWQSGIRHVFDNNGFIRNSTNCFNVVPDNTFDDSLRFKVGSLWTLDDGTTYICTDASTGAAVWQAQQGTTADWNPTLTLDATVVIAATVSRTLYSVNGNVATCSIYLDACEIDFTAGATGTIKFDYPIPSATPNTIGTFTIYESPTNTSIISGKIRNVSGQLELEVDEWTTTLVLTAGVIAIQFQYSIN